MSQLRILLSLVRWDLAVEFRRREAILNMCLFAVLLLFIGSYAVSAPKEYDAEAEFGPIFYWIAIVFSGTVGLSRAFLAEREGGALRTILVAPLEAGFYYLAKVIAVWLYVVIMSLLLLAAYTVLFDFEIYEEGWRRLWPLLAITGAFSLVYVAPGILLGAMTAGLQGGEVILRILLFPLLVPAIIVVLSANTLLFGNAEPDLEVVYTSPWTATVALLGLAAIYLSSCFLLFPRVVEE